MAGGDIGRNGIRQDIDIGVSEIFIINFVQNQATVKLRGKEHFVRTSVFSWQRLCFNTSNLNFMHT